MIVFLLLWAHQSGKPLHLDDVEHFGIAKAISETGKPLYYRGEDLPALSGALHPPLNDYLLAGWFSIFGVGVVQARTFAAVFTLLHGGALLLLMRCLFPCTTVERLAPWFWSLFLLNPYTLQMASMVDIDSSTYGPLLALLLWSVIRLSWREGERRIDLPRWWELGLITLLIAACLWTKLTTVLLAITFIFLIFLPRMKVLRALAVTTLTAGLGVFIFLVSFWLCCRLWGLNPVATFQFIYAMATSGGRLASRTDTLAFMALHLARWTGFLSWFAVAAATLGSLLSAWRNRRDARAPDIEMLLLLTLATASTIYYCASRLTFGNAPYKYTFVYYGLLMLPLAFFASRSPTEFSTERQTRRISWGLGGPWRLQVACCLVFSFGLFLALRVLGDSVIQRGWTRSSLLLLGVPAAAGGLACVLRGIEVRFARRQTQVVLLFTVIFHLGVQLGVASYQSRADYSTTYDYGQRGLAAAASFIQSRTDSGDLISSMKDVGLLAERRYVENYTAVYGGEKQARRLIERWESGKIRLIVFTEGIGQDQMVIQPLLRDWVSRNATLVASFGNYRIYEPRSATETDLP